MSSRSIYWIGSFNKYSLNSVILALRNENISTLTFMFYFIIKINSFTSIIFLFILAIIVVIVISVEGVSFVTLASSLSVLSSATEAKFVTTPTCHVITSLIFLYPEFTARALLYFCTFRECKELFFING